MPPTAATDVERGRSVDPDVWMASAGPSSWIPTVGSRVYYFPQGHIEQAASQPDLSAVRWRSPYALCLITAVRFLANPSSDEVYSWISLDPRASQPPSPEMKKPVGGGIVPFVKILTPSDANNGGGFSVPRFCADSIFPRLDFNANPPAQTIVVRDVHGKPWEFRHIFRGTPRRHLLTTGWSSFVNSKKLVAGDSVVFMKHHRSDELFVGIRRTSSRYAPPPGLGTGEKPELPESSVAEAIKSMEMGRPFEVLYFPKGGSPEFVVAEEAVNAASMVHWVPGLQVRMSVEAEDSRTSWVHGTVIMTNGGVGDWRTHFQWRMLQVNWDDPGVMQKRSYVNPWQVELVPAITHIPIPTSYQVMKKARVSLSTDLLSSDREGNMFFPIDGSNATKMGSLTPFLFNGNTFPAGMQGARHDGSVSSLYSFVPRNTDQFFSNELWGIDIPQKVMNLSTDLSIGGSSEPHATSPHSQGSILDDSTELNGASEVSFQLFGQIIRLKQPVDGSFNGKHRDTKAHGLSAVEACFL